MRHHRSVLAPVLAALVGALLLTGLVTPPPPAPDGDPVLVADVLVDDVVLAAGQQKHTAVTAGKVPGVPWVVVDVNPTLRGRRGYRVVLKSQYQGEWVRCTATRTQEGSTSPILGMEFGTGPERHEFAELKTSTCPGRANKAPRRYRVIVRAGAGFERTVSDVQRILRPSIHARTDGAVMYPDYGLYWVDVNPTLPGRRSYKVVLQRKDAGRWTRYDVVRTESTRCTSIFCLGAVVGRNPHETYGTWVPLGRYRVVVPKQHGLLRAVSDPVTLRYVP